MTKLLLYLISSLLLLDGVSRISKENALKNEAQEAFVGKDYKKAIERYRFLTDSLKVDEDALWMNLGHAYFMTNEPEFASKAYERGMASHNRNIRSLANQQLGVLAWQHKKDKPAALQYFKEALKANPYNEEARYNFELLSKMKEAKEPPKMQDKKKEDNQNKDQKKDQKDQQQNGGDKKNQDQANQKKPGDEGKKGSDENKDGKNGEKDRKEEKSNGGKGAGKQNDKEDRANKGEEGKGSDGKQSDKGKDENKDPQNKQAGTDEGEGGKNDKTPGDKKDPTDVAEGKNLKEEKGGKRGKEKIMANRQALMQMGMSEERASSLLEAMKGSETQYLQQLQKTPKKGQPKKGRPDW